MKKLVIILLLLPFVVFSQGKLKRAKENLNDTSSNVQIIQTSQNVNDENISYSNNDNVVDFQNLVFDILFYPTIGIVFGTMQKRDLNKYPYYKDNFGEYTRKLAKQGKRQNLKLGVNYMLNKFGGLELNAVYKPIPIIGIDASYVHFSEKDYSKMEYFDMVSLMANFYRIREKHISLWYGLGATYVGNEVKKTGFAYQIGTDIYPVKPISLHLSFKQSFVNQKSIDVFKSQLKYHFKNKAFYFGYHHYNLAGEEISSPNLGFEIYF